MKIEPHAFLLQTISQLLNSANCEMLVSNKAHLHLKNQYFPWLRYLQSRESTPARIRYNMSLVMLYDMWYASLDLRGSGLDLKSFCFLRDIRKVVLLNNIFTQAVVSSAKAR